MESYVACSPLPELAGGGVSTVRIQRAGDAPYTPGTCPRRDRVPLPLDGRPQLVGPLTGPAVEVIEPHTTIAGVEFHPGTAPPLPVELDDLVDQRLEPADPWRSPVDRLALAQAGALATGRRAARTTWRAWR